MNIGSKIIELRKKKSLTREALGKLIGTSGAVIGRYERQEITPSVEIANKMATSLGVSLDYLVGNVELELTDTLMERVKEVSKMSDKDKDHVFTLIDAFIAKNKMQAILK
jgi:transcriptional regulator with XRE-family HTH domain